MEKTAEGDVKMENLTYVVTDDSRWEAETFIVKVPKCCKEFFDWLISEGLVDGDYVTMEQVATNKIAFEIKENK